MTEVLACCGLNCSECRAYIATRTNDRKLAEDIAKLWSKSDGVIYSTEDIWCDGCHSDRLHGFCVRCQPRLCAKERKLTNCGVCEKYPCEKLQDLYNSWVESSPIEAKENLEKKRTR